MTTQPYRISAGDYAVPFRRTALARAKRKARIRLARLYIRSLPSILGIGLAGFVGQLVIGTFPLFGLIGSGLMAIGWPSWVRNWGTALTDRIALGFVGTALAAGVLVCVWGIVTLMTLWGESILDNYSKEGKR